jgi:hypothetical protein
MSGLRDPAYVELLRLERQAEADMERAGSGAARDGWERDEPERPKRPAQCGWRGALSTGVTIVVGAEAVSRLAETVVHVERWILVLATLGALSALFVGPDVVRALLDRRRRARERANGLGL